MDLGQIRHHLHLALQSLQGVVYSAHQSPTEAQGHRQLDPSRSLHGNKRNSNKYRCRLN
jgi:hypothetical protein